MRFKQMDIWAELEGPTAPSVKFNCIYDEEKTLLFLCIDDQPSEPYVAILDGNYLLDVGVIGLNYAGDLSWLTALSKDDYVKSVLWDKPYTKTDNISRGTVWMTGLNEFLKIINKNG